MNEDRCVCCGEIIPEGQMVCPNCLLTVKKQNKSVLIRVTKEPMGVFPKYCPKVGKVYEAEYVPGKKHSAGDLIGNKAFCIVDILDKRISLRADEFEIVGGTEDD